MRLPLLIIAMLLIVPPVMAGNYYENFESYAPGTLSLPGLGGNGPWGVVANSALNGTKAIAPYGAYDCSIPFPAAPTFGNGTVVSINALMDSGEYDYFAWNLLNGDTNTPFVGLCSYGGQVLVAQNGYQWFYDESKTMYANHKYLLSAELNFTKQTAAYNIRDLTDLDPNNSFSFSFAFASETTAAQASRGGFYLSGPGSMYDNLSVSTVPEPSALVALGTGLMGICGFSIRRRK